MIANEHYLVPTHNEGIKKDISVHVTAESIEDAEDWFVDAKDRLLDINTWKKQSGIFNADIKLTDMHGKMVNRPARKGDYMRLDTSHARAEATAADFEWLYIEAIEYDDYPDIGMESIALRMHPSNSPKMTEEPITYDTATSIFVIERRGKTLFATFHGRNDMDRGVSTKWLALPEDYIGNLLDSLLE